MDVYPGRSRARYGSCSTGRRRSDCGRLASLPNLQQSSNDVKSCIKNTDKIDTPIFAFDNHLTQFSAFKIRRNAGCFCKVLFLVNLAIDTEWSSTLYMNMLK